MDLNILVALLAGFISFLSPCIFPIIPSYIGYIGAATYDDGYKKNKGALPLILAFIFGFTIIFSLMGIAFSTLGFAFKNYADIISKISGLLVIVLGLNSIFSFISFLDYEKKASFKIKNKGFFSSLILGMAFGAGWSPCIGPILASILFLAGNTTTLLSGIILLLFFSIGLGIPFLLSGLFISSFREKSQGIKKHMGKIKIASGILIILIGISIFFNKLTNINVVLNTTAINFSNWYNLNSSVFNISLSIVLFAISLLLILKAVKRFKIKKQIVSYILFTILFMSLGILSSFSIINWGSLIQSYLSFQGI